MAIATITAANLLTKLSVTSVTGLDSIRVTLTSGSEAAELTSLLNAFTNNTAPMLIGVGLQVRLGDGTTVITFAKDGNGVFKAYNGTEEYIGPLASDMLNVFNAFYADRLPSIAEINQKLAVDLNGAISDIAQVQTAIADLPDIRNAIGQQDDPSTSENEATGLYATIANAVAAAVATLTADIEAVAADVATNTGNITTNATAIGNLQTALNTLSTTVGTNDAAIKAIIGTAAKDAVPAVMDGDTVVTPAVEAVAATGLYATIDNAIASAVSGIQSQINELINDAVGGNAPSTDSIEGLKAALSALSGVVGDSSSGLVQQLASLTTTVTELGSALTAGYTAAKSAYDAAVTAAATSKGFADAALTAYTEAAAAVNNSQVAGTPATKAQAALTAAQDYYAKAVTAKTDADMVVAKANTVTIAAAQTPSTADDAALVTDGVTVAQAAATAQGAAVNAVIMANSNVNAATIVLSNATLDASNQVIVTFIDYSSAAAATTSDISAANTAKNAYDAAKTTFDNAMTLNNANALKTAATNFNTAALKAQTTAAAALEKANTSSAAADTTSSTADDDIADTNVATATAAKATADGLATTAAANLALATAYANVPVVMALDGINGFKTGFSVTDDAVVTVTVDNSVLDATAMAAKFTKTTADGVDTYTAKVGAFDGSETTIAVSAVMQTEIGTQTISSVAATIADLDIDTTAPAAPTVNDIEGGGVVNAADVTDGLQVTGTAEAGSTVSVQMAGTTKTTTADTNGAFSVTFTDSEVPTFGSFGVDVKATDAAGNISAYTSPIISIDTDADSETPDLSITIATDNEVTNLAESTAVAFTLAGIDSDAASVKVEFTDTAAPPNKVTVNATKSGTTWTVGTANLNGLTDGEITATVTVTDTAGNTATATDTLTLAATAAKVTTVALTADNEANFDELNAGDIVTATVTMDKAVTVTGTPTLTLVIGTTEVQATYDATNSNTTALQFNYTILADQTDTDGISIKADGIVLGTDVTIVDANGNAATLTFAAVDANNDYIVDTTVPTAVATITALSSDTEASGATNGTDFNTKTASQTVSGTYTGTLATGEKFQVSVDGGITWVETTVNTANSTWTTAGDAITLVTGANTLSVRTIDAAGNVTSGADKGYTLDQTAPTVIVSGIDISADTGVSADDFNTKTESQTISATLSTALGTDETLWGSVDGGANWTNISAITNAVSGTSVSWANATLTNANGATPEIQFQVRDAAGNAGATATQAYVLDTTLSGAEVAISQLLDNVGAISGDMVAANKTTTDDTTPTLVISLTGTLAADETVVVYDTYNSVTTRLGTATLDTTANSPTNGKYLFTPTTPLTEDTNHTLTHTLTAVVEDTAGNQSAGSTFASLSIDTTSPTTAVTITAVADNTGEGPTTGDTTSDTSLIVSGNFGGSAADAALGGSEKLYIYDGTTYLGEATVTVSTGGGQSTWSYTDARTLTDAQVVNYIAKLTNTVTGTQGTPSGTFNITIDTTAPTVSITSDVAAVKIGETATITFTFSEVPVGFAEGDITVTGGALSGFAVSGTDAKVYTATFTPTESLEGSASITIAANSYTDAAANNGGAGATPTLAIDTIAPTAPTTVTLTAVGGTVKTNTLNSTNTNLTASAAITAAQATDGKAELYIGTVKVAEDTSIASGDTSVSFDLGLTGNAALQTKIAAGGVASVKLYDKAGNSVTSTASNPTLTVDYVAPATPNATLTTDSGTADDNYTNSGAITAPANAENDATVEYRTKKDDGQFGDWGAYSAPTTGGSADGVYTVEVRQTDVNGNVSATQTITYTLDSTVAAPTITGLTNDTGSSATDKTTKDMTLTLSGVETGALVEYSINGTDWLSKTQYDGLADGTYSVVVRQTDKAGNVSAASTALAGIVKDTAAPAAVTFTIDDNGTNTTDGVTSNAVVNISKANDVVKWEYTLNGTAGTPTWFEGTGTTFSLGTTDVMFATGDIQVRGYDLAGNMTTATSNTMAYRLDKTAPMAGTPAIKHYDSNGVEKTGDYVVGDYIEFFFNEQLSAVPTKTAGDSFGNLASFSLSESGTSAFIQLKTSETIDVGDAISLQVIDLVGQQSTINFTLI